MKNYGFLLLLLLFTFSCASDDDTETENGTNPSPNLHATGSSAHDFLSADKYTKLDIQIVYVTGFRPNEQTITNLRNFITARLNKPGGVTITETEVSSTGEAPYDLNEVAALESQYRTKYNLPDTLTFYLFFADGGSENDTTNSFILGTAYRNTSCVLYENSIQNLSNAINEPNRVDLETTVILHELGHLLGLVNLGSTMQTAHEDTGHDKHCNNNDCLMYWQVENSANLMQMMAGGNVPQLDANCLADLAANGGK
ncbi:MAG TPA: hypothetical protein VK623_07035 [Flavobacterium sp.]|nr:hypothetical protein [Flavobacterium sp.]